jgi:tetratricopeptide (TPR) repeat protein
LPSAEKLAKKGNYLEAAQLFEQQAASATDVSEKHRCFDSAARCYESAGKLCEAVTCYVKAESSRATEAAMNACARSGHPEYFSAAMSQLGKREEAIRRLITSSLSLLREGKTSQAQEFCDEALRLNSDNVSRLPDGFVNVLNGVDRNDPEKINAGIKICEDVGFADSALADEIILYARKMLSEFSNVRVVSTRRAENGRLQNLTCPKCGGPLTKNSQDSRVMRCEYCGNAVVVE